MKNIIVQLDKNKGKAKAREYFLDTCGLYRRKDINPKHIADSLRTLDDIYDCIRINAIFSKYDRCVQGDKLTCEDITFQCRAFSQVPGQDILSAFIYILTVGEIYPSCERVLYQVYYDIWQTAFVDAGRDLLKEYISDMLSYTTFGISDSFGPGFWGMPAADTKKIFRILNADRIGVRIKPNGLMLPVKSCAGFFLVTAKEESLATLSIPIVVNRSSKRDEWNQDCQSSGDSGSKGNWY